MAWRIKQCMKWFMQVCSMFMIGKEFYSAYLGSNETDSASLVSNHGSAAYENSFETMYAEETLKQILSSLEKLQNINDPSDLDISQLAELNALLDTTDIDALRDVLRANGAKQRVESSRQTEPQAQHTETQHTRGKNVSEYMGNILDNIKRQTSVIKYRKLNSTLLTLLETIKRENPDKTIDNPNDLDTERDTLNFDPKKRSSSRCKRDMNFWQMLLLNEFHYGMDPFLYHGAILHVDCETQKETHATDEL